MRILVVGPTGRTGRHVIEALRAHDPAVAIRGFCRHPNRLARSIEIIPGNLDVGTTQARVIETIPGNLDGGTTHARVIETIPGNLDGGATQARVIETISGNLDGGATAAGALEIVAGDLGDPGDRARAVDGVGAVIHYAPAFHPREAELGIALIDAAVAAGARRFVYVSARHAQTDDAAGDAAKRRIEGHLAASGLDWTVLRPQRFMQNIDVAAVLAAGALELPGPVALPLGHVDLADVAAAIAKVTLEQGHALASYDIASDEALSTAELAATIAKVSGETIGYGELPVPRLLATLQALGAAPHELAALEGRHAANARHGNRGNANILRWLLGREPGSFEDYVRRTIATA